MAKIEAHACTATMLYAQILFARDLDSYVTSASFAASGSKWQGNGGLCFTSMFYCFSYICMTYCEFLVRVLSLKRTRQFYSILFYSILF